MDLCSVKCVNEKKVAETIQSLPGLDGIAEMANIFKALGDPSRLKIVLTLLNQEHCVCDIAAICNQSDSAISHQLRILRTLKIVKNRRDGKMLFYTIDDDHVKALINMSLDHLKHETNGSVIRNEYTI